MGDGWTWSFEESWFGVGVGVGVITRLPLHETENIFFLENCSKSMYTWRIKGPISHNYLFFTPKIRIDSSFLNGRQLSMRSKSSRCGQHLSMRWLKSKCVQLFIQPCLFICLSIFLSSISISYPFLFSFLFPLTITLPSPPPSQWYKMKILVQFKK